MVLTPLARQQKGQLSSKLLYPPPQQYSCRLGRNSVFHTWVLLWVYYEWCYDAVFINVCLNKTTAKVLALILLITLLKYLLSIRFICKCFLDWRHKEHQNVSFIYQIMITVLSLEIVYEKYLSGRFHLQSQKDILNVTFRSTSCREQREYSPLHSVKIKRSPLEKYSTRLEPSE